MPSYALIEPCCGSFALTLHMLGAKQALMPYQGSKWKHRRALARIMERAGYTGEPDTVVLADTGPWAQTAKVVLSKAGREEVIGYLQGFVKQDPRAVFDILDGFGYAEDENMALRAAQHLFLQRLAFSGKAVGIDENGRWRSPGFNKTSAYGTPGTKRFGPVRPMVPSLIKVLESYATLPEVRVLTFDQAVDTLLACLTHTTHPPSKPPVVFLDPPYKKGTAYPNGTFGRPAVVNHAVSWWDAGAFVMVSEGETIDELAERGWVSVCIHKGRGDTSRFRGQQEEHVTYAAKWLHAP